MKLRELRAKDAQLMLEWMHDPDVVKDLRRDFASKTLEDCLQFIQSSKNSKEDLHCAVVNDDDEYMGTVSLKHIRAGKAEFGITVRSCAMGKGYETCGDCVEVRTCEKAGMILGNNEDARRNLNI